MTNKPPFALLVTASILAGALMLPSGAFAHDHPHSGYRWHDHGWSHPGRSRHRHESRHERRVIHEYRYAPVYVPVQPYRRGDRHHRDQGTRNRVTIIYSGGWD